MRRVLKLPEYRRLLGAYTLNELAFSVGSLALAVLVYRRTGSAIGAAGFFLSAQFVPALISPSVVARLEQRPARQVLPALYAVECVAFLVLAWVASRFSLAPVLALALLDGIAALTARSIARATTVTVTAPAGLLREGNALANTLLSICVMAGPAVGGVIVATGGTSVALLANGGLFALISLMLVAGRLPGPVPIEGPSSGRVRAALAQARRRPMIRSLLSLQAAALLFFTMSIPVEVVFAQHSLHAGAGGYGALLAAWGAGLLAGSGVYARWHGRPARMLIALGSAAFGAGFVVMAVAPTLLVAIIGAAVAGAGNGIEVVAARTALQEAVQPAWMALMMSLNESITQLMPGAGILLGGGIAALAGARAALAVAGAGALAIAGAAWVVVGAAAAPDPGEQPEAAPREPSAPLVSGVRTGRDNA